MSDQHAPYDKKFIDSWTDEELIERAHQAGKAFAAEPHLSGGWIAMLADRLELRRSTVAALHQRYEWVEEVFQAMRPLWLALTRGNVLSLQGEKELVLGPHQYKRIRAALAAAMKESEHE